MRNISLRTDSLLTARDVIYAVYSMLGAAVASASVARAADGSWPVTFHLDGPDVVQAERDLLTWATNGLRLPWLFRDEADEW